jgi:hypothetical protein
MFLAVVLHTSCENPVLAQINLAVLILFRHSTLNRQSYMNISSVPRKIITVWPTKPLTTHNISAHENTIFSCDLLQAGFVLVIGFIAYLYNSLVHFTNHYTTHWVFCLLHSSLAISRQRLPTADVPLGLGSWTVPNLSYQILTVTAPNNWTMAAT